MNGPRYAVYYAPAAGSPWWAFGAGWLGRDERAAAPLAQAVPPEFAPGEFHALTAEPRRYGFHATLKAPFRLREGVTEALLRSRLAALAAQLRPVPMAALMPTLIADFVALAPAPRSPGVAAVAARCVIALDDLRAPLTPEEKARRQPERLDDTGRRLLDAYGYPHVLERFRFHMTLSGPVDAGTGDRLVACAGRAIAHLNLDAPLQLDRLCLFREAAPGAPFLRVHDEELSAQRTSLGEETR